MQASIAELEKQAMDAAHVSAAHFTTIAEQSESLQQQFRGIDCVESTSGKKRPRRKPEHPQRVLDNSDSRGEGGRLSTSEDDSLSNSRSSLSKLLPSEEEGARKRACYGSDAPGTPPAPPVEASARYSGKRSGPNGSSPPASLAAAATAALNAAVEKGMVARTIGFEAACPAALSPSRQLNAALSAAQSPVDKRVAGSPAPATGCVIVADTSAVVATHPGKSTTKEKGVPSTAAAVVAAAVEKERAKTITAFFAPSNPGKLSTTNQASAPPAMVDINHDSLEGTISEPIFSSRTKPSSFAGVSKSPFSTTLSLVPEPGSAPDASADSHRLRVQLEQAQSALKQVTAALSKASSDNEAFREDVARLKLEVELAQSAASKSEGEHEGMRRSIATNLVNILKDSAVRDAAVFRRTIAENQIRLGRIVPHRTGASVYEVRCSSFCERPFCFARLIRKSCRFGKMERSSSRLPVKKHN
jgi:hypothetical protein